MALRNCRVRLGFYLATSLVFVAGCGPVDLQQLKPTVWKPSAEVLLYQTPARWQATSVLQAADSTGVVTKAVYVSSLQGSSGLIRRMNSSSAGLVVVVSGRQLTQTDLRVATHKLGTRFEVIQTAPFSGASLNVRQVVADLPAAAYSIGWLAGQFSTYLHAATVGWVGKGTKGGITAVERAALGGLYQAAPTTKLSAVFQVAPSGSGTSNSALMAPIVMPRVIIADRPLSPVEAAVVKTAGSVVLFLSPTAGEREVVAEPSLPSLNTLVADLMTFRNLRWKAGIAPVQSAPYVELNASLVPLTLQQPLSDLERSVEAQPSLVPAAWGLVPSTIKASWLIQLE